MSDSENQVETVPRDATEVRFGMRAMLIVMAVVAVATTALGAFIRHFPNDVQLRLSAYWGILAAILAGLIAFYARQRYLAERKAGHVLFLLTPHSYFIPRAPGLASVVAGTLLLAVAPAMWIVGSFAIALSNSWEHWFRAMNWSAFYSLIATGTGVTIFWWRRIRLAEYGLVIRNRFVPWENCRWYWDACNKNVLVFEFDVNNRHGSMAVKVPAEDRAAAETLLDEKREMKRRGQQSPVTG